MNHDTQHVTSQIVGATMSGDGNFSSEELTVELAHIDGGSEGVLLLFRKAVEAYAADRYLRAIYWHVYALTCAKRNPRLQRFLRKRAFTEVDHEKHRPIFALSTSGI